MPLICLTALFSGVLNGMDRFAAAAAAPVVFNAVSIAVMLGLRHALPTAGHALSWGVTVSGVCQLALLVWAVRRAGMTIHIPRPRMTPRMWLLVRRMGPGLLSAGVTQLNLSVDVIIGSLLPSGTVSVLYYADRINQLPLGTIGIAVGTALLPTLSRQVRAGAAAEAVGTLNRAIEYALVLTLPATVALIVIAEPVIAVLFQRGAFGAESVRLSAQALAAYAAGLPAFVLVKVLLPAFFARGDTAMPMKVGLAAVGVNLALNIAFMTPLQHLGPPLASSLSAWVNVAVLVAILVRRGHLATDATLRRVVPRTLLAALAMAAVLWGLDQLLFAPAPRAELWRWAALGTLVGGGLAAYGLAGLALGAFSQVPALAALARRIARRA